VVVHRPSALDHCLVAERYEKRGKFWREKLGGYTNAHSPALDPANPQCVRFGETNFHPH
jgi:hypothetical protein